MLIVLKQFGPLDGDELVVRFFDLLLSCSLDARVHLPTFSLFVFFLIFFVLSVESGELVPRLADEDVDGRPVHPPIARVHIWVDRLQVLLVFVLNVLRFPKGPVLWQLVLPIYDEFIVA